MTLQLLVVDGKRDRGLYQQLQQQPGLKVAFCTEGPEVVARAQSTPRAVDAVVVHWESEVSWENNQTMLGSKLVTILGQKLRDVPLLVMSSKWDAKIARTAREY